MKFIHTETQEVVGRKELQAATNKSFAVGKPITDDQLSDTAWRVLNEGNKPEPEALKVIEQTGVAEVEGQWVRVWTKRDMTNEELAEHKASLKRVAKAMRMQRETGGFMLGDMFIESDEKTERRIIGAWAKAKDDSDYSIADWKVGNDFVTLDAATLIAIGDALSAHISQSFTFEKAVNAEIESGDLLTDQAVRERYQELVNGA